MLLQLPAVDDLPKSWVVECPCDFRVEAVSALYGGIKVCRILDAGKHQIERTGIHGRTREMEDVLLVVEGEVHGVRRER